TMLLGFYFDVVAWFFHFEQSSMDVIAVVLLTFVTFTLLLLIFQLFVLAYQILTHSLLELQTAQHFRQQISDIQISKRIQGIEQE
ncbi:MAG: hypothetical protein AAF738_00735, partial [Bacteroidota bacterium]